MRARLAAAPAQAMIRAMERARRLGLPLACLAAALLLHKTFCEWRRVEYPVSGAAAHEALLLLSVRSARHPAGNAERWDEEERALRAYDAAWLSCHRALYGDPAAGSELARCLAARPYPVIGATAEAVARAECEREHDGRLREPGPLAECLRARGYAEPHVPRWAFERIGLRFDEPYVTRSALFAEALFGSPGASRLAGLGLGVAIPLLLAFLAARSARGGRRVGSAA